MVLEMGVIGEVVYRVCEVDRFAEGGTLRQSDEQRKVCENFHYCEKILFVGIFVNSMSR